MKKLILVIFLVSFSTLFPAFEVDVIGELSAVTGFPILDSQTVKINGSTEVRPDLSVQIGYMLPMQNGLKGISLLGDVMIEQTTIGITYPGDKKIVNKESGLSMGLGFTTKFVIGNVNSLIPRDTVLGVGVAAKALIYAPNIVLTMTPPPISIYFKTFVEQRFFIFRQLAFVVGLNLYVDYMLPMTYKVDQLFMGYFVTSYLDLGIGLSVGLHFGN